MKTTILLAILGILGILQLMHKPEPRKQGELSSQVERRAASINELQKELKNK